MSYVQRETPILAQLCELLVQDQSGELAARVFSVLARYGRQTLSALSKASYLNGKQIKHGLVVLIQQHLIFHSAALDPRGTSYEIDWQQSYALVRYGRILRSVEERFGEKPANVMSNLIALGHTRVRDFREAYFPPSDAGSEPDDGRVNGASDAKPNGIETNGVSATAVTVLPDELDDAKPSPEGLEGLVNGDSHAPVNGNTKVNGVKRPHPGDDSTETEQPVQEDGTSSIKSIAELDSIIHHLMMHGWIMKGEEMQYRGPGDFHDHARQQILEEELGGKQPTGPKERNRLALGTLQRKRAVRNRWSKVPDFPTRKRKGTESEFERSSKRTRLADGNAWAAPRDEVIVLDENLVIRINPEKVAVAMRSDLLVHLAQQRLGHVTSKVYETMLRTLEKNIGRCFEEWPDPPPPDASGAIEMDSRWLVSAREVAKKIDTNIDLFEGLDPAVIVQLSYSGSQVNKKNIIDPPIDPFKLDLDIKARIVDEHIKALANHPFHFVTWHSRDGLSSWYVEFEEIAQAMIQNEVENTVAAGTEREMKYGVKLVRALKKKGKLEERQMCSTMMMQAADVRGVVNALTLRGFLQTQEIPKVERREARHSHHLIWYDKQRAREKLLHETYKGMCRALQRLAFERENVQELLSKAERTDVAGNEEKWLSQDELNALKKWKGVQGRLLVQLFRMDEVVATLRDFIGPIIST